MAIGINIARYAASQSGWPRVEKILIVGIKSAVQQETSKLPLKRRQVGSYPKCDGRPQSATISPEIKLVVISLWTLASVGELLRNA